MVFRYFTNEDEPLLRPRFVSFQDMDANIFFQCQFTAPFISYTYVHLEAYLYGGIHLK